MTKERLEEISKYIESKTKGKTIKHFDDIDEFQQFSILANRKDEEGTLYPHIRTFVKLPYNCVFKDGDRYVTMDHDDADDSHNFEEVAYEYNCYEKIFKNIQKGKSVWYYGEYMMFPFIETTCCMVEEDE